MPIPFQDANGNSEVQDDPDDENVLDFTFDRDGTIRYAGRFAAARRSKIKAISDLVGQVLAGQGGEQALGGSLVSLAEAIEAACEHFQRCARRFPDRAEFCERNLAAYGRARAALDVMYAYLDQDPRPEVLNRGYVDLEAAVADVDALVSEEET